MGHTVYAFYTYAGKTTQVVTARNKVKVQNQFTRHKLFRIRIRTGFS